MKSSSKTLIYNSFKESISISQEILENIDLIKEIEFAAKRCVEAYQAKKKLLLCGNGGSAADAQHIAAELSGRFYIDRPPLDAQALHVNSSYLTAVANDYGYNAVYSRMVKSVGNSGDVLIAISTSGNSKNVLEALKEAKKAAIFTIGLTGIDGGRFNELCDLAIKVPSDNTARIQEMHIFIGHIICQIIEEELF